ncbi:MAG: OmpA family protein [Bacteroidota bacterium]
MKQIFATILLNCLFVVSYGQQTTDKSISLLSQSKYEKANMLFDRLAFFDAAILFEDLVKQNVNVNKIAPKLADCYLNMSLTDKAELWYEKAVQFDSIDSYYYFKYAQALRCNKKYDEANKWMEKYKQKKLDDKIASNYSNNKDYATKITNQKSLFSVTNFNNINTEYSDFGAVMWNNKISFVTASDVKMAVKNTHAWNEKPFLDIMIFDTIAKKNKVSNFSSKINTQYHEGSFCFDSTGNTMYFTRNNFYQGKKVDSDKGINNLMLYKSVFINGKWQNIESLPFNNKNYSVGHPALSFDGKKLFFVSNMPGGIGGTDIYYVDIKENGYSMPVNLGPEINTEGNEMFPFVSKEFIYFSSDGHIGLGGLDVFCAKYCADGSFKNVSNLGTPVNSSKDDFSFVLNKDEKSGFLASNREGGKGDDDIYIIKSDAPKALIISGVVTDSITFEPISNTKILILNENDGVKNDLLTDAKGEFEFPANYNTKYRISTSNNDYAPITKNVSTENTVLSDIKTKFPLKNVASIALVGSIFDRTTKKGVNGVKISINDLSANTLVKDTTTNESGDVNIQIRSVKVGEVLKYEIKIDKEGYLAKKVLLEHKIKDLDNINLNEYLDVVLDKIEVGADIGKIIDIKPIYFDLAKSNIRTDAAAELDKIVKVMTDNPSMVVELGSHTDCRGSAKYNFELSDQRAKSSVAYIISKGVDKARIYGKGYGESKLVNGCACEGTTKSTCSEEEHQLNRRTEFIIVKI